MASPARVEKARIVDRRQLAQAAPLTASAFRATAELHHLWGLNDEPAIDADETEDIRLEEGAAS